jgi:tetrahydromethanopterin S-methyltransferase subunit D
MNAKPSLVSELRRRNVFRVALTYAVVASLLIQVASVFVPMLDAPEWIITAFVVGAGAWFRRGAALISAAWPG